MKNPGVFSWKNLFLDLAFLKEVRQVIGHSVYFALAIIDPKMVPKELFGLPDLSKA